MGLKVHHIIMSDNLFYVHKYNQILLYLTQNAIHQTQCYYMENLNSHKHQSIESTQMHTC